MDAFLVIIKLATLTCFVNIADDDVTYNRLQRIMDKADYHTADFYPTKMGVNMAVLSTQPIEIDGFIFTCAKN